MKRYIKENTIKWDDEIVISDGKHDFYNPTEEMILADGWEEYVEPEPTIEEVKQRKIEEIDMYDKSSAVNEFYLKGTPCWLDKATRVGLTNSLNYEKNAGRQESTMWFNGVAITLPIDDAFKMLEQLELYALECYNVTANHKANVNNLTTITEVQDYNYRLNYPEKLKL